MKKIALWFIPLAFLGGLSMGSIWIAVGGILLWAVIYLLIPK